MQEETVQVVTPVVNEIISDENYENINFDQLANKVATQEIESSTTTPQTSADIVLEDLLVDDSENNDLSFVAENGEVIDLSTTKEWNKTEESTVDNQVEEEVVYVGKQDPVAKLSIDEENTNII